MFVELSALSNFTFLTGASHPEEYAQRASLLGLPALAIADVNSVAGIVRAYTEIKEIARQVRLRQEAEAREGLIGPPPPREQGAGSCCVASSSKASRRRSSSPS